MASFSPINVADLPVAANYYEYLIHAGSSGIAAKYDEETGTLKIYLTDTPTFHTIGSKWKSITDLGTAKFAMTVQAPEQLRVLSRVFMCYAQLLEWLQDPDYPYKEELMGLKHFTTKAQ